MNSTRLILFHDVASFPASVIAGLRRGVVHLWFSVQSPGIKPHPGWLVYKQELLLSWGAVFLGPVITRLFFFTERRRPFRSFMHCVVRRHYAAAPPRRDVFLHQGGDSPVLPSPFPGPTSHPPTSHLVEGTGRFPILFSTSLHWPFIDATLGYASSGWTNHLRFHDMIVVGFNVRTTVIPLAPLLDSPANLPGSLLVLPVLKRHHESTSFLLSLLLSMYRSDPVKQSTTHLPTLPPIVWLFRCAYSFWFRSIPDCDTSTRFNLCLPSFNCRYLDWWHTAFLRQHFLALSFL